MRSQSLRINVFIFSVFLLMWSTNAYFILGNSLKLSCLFLGFIGVVTSTFTMRINKKSIKFAIISILFLLLYWAIAYFNEQQTLETTLLIFDVICVFLLISGYIISQNINLNIKFYSLTIIIVCFLTIIGTYFFLKNQTLLSIQTSSTQRIASNSDDDNINAIGLAYTNASLLFLLFFLLREKYLKKWLKIFIIISIICSVVILVSTSSRGAMLYVVFLLILFYLSKIKSIKTLIRSMFILLLSIIILIGVYFGLKDFFPIIEAKVEFTFKRFETLFSFLESGSGDGSSAERKEFYDYFFKNLNDFILLGENNYHPYPHNIFMEILMRWGLFGVPLIIFVITKFIKALGFVTNKIELIPLNLLFSFLLLFSILMSLSSMSLEMNRGMWLTLGFIWGVNKKL